MRKIVFTISYVIFCVAMAQAQTNEGNEFWFGFMEHVDKNDNTKVAMITAKSTTSGIISVPGENWSQSFTVPGNSVTIINLPDFTEFIGSEFKDNNGIRVISQEPVSVYIHQFSFWRSEAAVILPTESLGSEYFVMSYTAFSNQGTIYPSEFLMVASEDETTISFEVTDETKGGMQIGDSKTIILNQGETYQVQSRDANGDLTGSHIVSDKNIAVLSGNSWTQVPTGCNARDNLLEQMYPVETWGNQFVSVPNADVAFDVFRILASQDNTNITVSGNTTDVFNLDSGEFVEYTRNDATYIESDKAILVAQFNAGFTCTGNPIGDPSMMLLNTVKQTRDTVTLYNSSFENITRNFINVVVYTTDVPFTSFDGQLLTDIANVQEVSANSQFSYARVSVNPGAHTIISQGCGVIANAYGYGDAESYSYSGGASFNKINANPIPEGGCLNDTIFFDVGLKPPRHSFQWDLGDGGTSTLGKFQHFYPQLGSYPVQLIVTDHCLDEVDTFYRDLRITLRQEVDALDGIEICEGGSIELEATDLPGARYEWTGPNDFFSEEQFPILTEMDPSEAGPYSVIGIISGCATYPAITDVVIHPTPMPELGKDTFVCRFDDPVVLYPGDFRDYIWQDGSTYSNLIVDREGDYSVEVVDEYGCSNSDSIFIRERCPTKVFTANIFSPNRDGINDDFCVQGTDIETMELNIFDRWGNLVFKSSSPDECWDGTFLGRDVVSGVYSWVMRFTGFNEDGEELIETRFGDLTLLR